MTPSELAGFFNGTAEPVVGQRVLMEAVERYLTKRDPTLPPMRTADVAEALWPVKQTAPEHMTARKRMVDTLLRLGKTALSDFATRSDRPMGQFMGKPRYPLSWHPPRLPRQGQSGTGPAACPTCGRAL